MNQVKKLSSLSAGFLQDSRSWIILPRWVEYSTSRDGKNFKVQGRVDHQVDPRDETAQVHEFTLPVNVEARYVKVLAKNYGALPEWHLGAGGQAHLFIDEVTIR